MKIVLDRQRMKRTLFIITAIVCIMSLASYNKYDDTELRQRLDKLEGSTINTINQQISAIENTIAVL